MRSIAGWRSSHHQTRFHGGEQVTIQKVKRGDLVRLKGELVESEKIDLVWTSSLYTHRYGGWCVRSISRQFNSVD